ncbi:MAG: hypothetical protein VB980_04915, partial [Opitutales bacterium]
MSDLKQLERELSALRPTKPRAGFTTNIEKALGESGNVAIKQDRSEEVTTDEPTSLLSRFAPLTIAAAVALGAFFAVTHSVTEDKPSTTSRSSSHASTSVPSLPAFPGDGWKASEVNDHFLGGRDEGVVHRVGQAPARRFRYRFLGETVWKHPKANAVIRSTIPREEVVLV